MDAGYQDRVVDLLKYTGVYERVAKVSKRTGPKFTVHECGCVTARSLLGGVLVPFHCAESAARRNGYGTRGTCQRPRDPIIRTFLINGRVLGPADLGQ